MATDFQLFAVVVGGGALLSEGSDDAVTATAGLETLPVLAVAVEARSAA